MAVRTKILVVDPDIDSLSKIYLNLLHRNYKVEACDDENEISERMKRLKPGILIITSKAYWPIEKALKIPVIVLLEEGDEAVVNQQDDVRFLRKPLTTDVLLQEVQRLVI